MTTSYRERGVYVRPYSEKEYFMNDRFYPGELGMVALLAIASLLVWAVAIYGITNEPKPQMTYSNGTNAY
jgi:hypothetical protein